MLENPRKNTIKITESVVLFTIVSSLLFFLKYNHFYLRIAILKEFTKNKPPYNNHAGNVTNDKNNRTV
jgi:hypothetical protein